MQKLRLKVWLRLRLRLGLRLRLRLGLRLGLRNVFRLWRVLTLFRADFWLRTLSATKKT